MTIYEDMAARTGGNVYIGVTGPVRSGKSTFVKRMMEELVIPNISDEYRAERARDELPQCGSGRTIMTAEPKFVPEEAVVISPDSRTKLSVRLIDSVGYMIPGAIGATENGAPRMVTTPWFDREIPMTEAAEIGTRKVMENHCTVGIVVTTDGSISDIPRKEYLDAEQRAVRDMADTGKPFLVLLNTAIPESQEAQDLARWISEQYGCACRSADCQTMTKTEIGDLLRVLLEEFPVEEFRFYFPSWFDALEPEHPVKRTLYAAAAEGAKSVKKLSQAEQMTGALNALDEVTEGSVTQIDLGSGSLSFRIRLREGLFYEILSQRCGVPLKGDGDLLRVLSRYRGVKQRFDRLQSALEQVQSTGYGIVMPARDEVELQIPEMIRKGGTCGIRLRASAPSIHMLRADVYAEVSPMVGDEKQTGELVKSLVDAYEGDEDRLWESNIFGKTLYDLVNESLSDKLSALPETSRIKVKNALTRIVNEGAKGLICIVL